METIEIIELLNDIIIELHCRESSCNVIIPELYDVSWVDLCDRGVKLFEKIGSFKANTSVTDFRNDLINRLNNNANRYVGGTCNGRFYPEVEMFDVDEVYEIIDRVYDGVPEDTVE